MESLGVMEGKEGSSGASTALGYRNPKEKRGLKHFVVVGQSHAQNAGYIRGLDRALDEPAGGAGAPRFHASVPSNRDFGDRLGLTGAGSKNRRKLIRRAD